MRIGYIYRIFCLDDAIKDCYIGSCWKIKDRMGNHKSNCNNINRPSYNYKVYTFIRANGNWSNWDYEYYMVNVIDKTDLGMKEQDRIDLEINPILNDKRAYTDILEYQKQYRIDNKESIKQYKIDNKESIKQSNKQYRIDNKESIKQSNKQYRIDNKESIKLRQNKKYTCKCGGKYTHNHKARHLRSPKHQSYIIQV